MADVDIRAAIDTADFNNGINKMIAALGRLETIGKDTTDYISMGFTEVVNSMTTVNTTISRMDSAMRTYQADAKASLNTIVRELGTLNSTAHTVNNNMTTGFNMVIDKLRDIKHDLSGVRTELGSISTNTADTVTALNTVVAELQKLNAEASKANDTLEDILNNNGGSGGGGDSVSSVNDLHDSISSVKDIMSSVLALGFGAELVKDIAEATGYMQQLEASFRVLLGSASQAKNMLGDVVNFAMTTPFDLKGTADATKQLLAYGVAAKDVIETERRLGDVGAALGLTMRDLAYLYGTTKTQNRLYALDMRQFTTRGIPLLETLSKQLNVTTADITKMVTAGQIGFKEVQDAIWTMTDAGGKFGGLMAAQFDTIKGQLSNLEDAWYQFYAALGNSADIKFDITDSIKHFNDKLNQLAYNADILIDCLGNLVQALIAVGAIQGIAWLGKIITSMAAFNTGLVAARVNIGGVTTAGLQATTMAGALQASFVNMGRAISAATGVFSTCSAVMAGLSGIISATMPYIALAMAIYSIVSACIAWNSEIDYIGDAHKKLGDAFHSASNEVSRLFTNLENTAAGSKSHTAAVNELMEKLVENNIVTQSYIDSLQTEAEKIQLVIDKKKELIELEARNAVKEAADTEQTGIYTRLQQDFIETFSLDGLYTQGYLENNKYNAEGRDAKALEDLYQSNKEAYTKALRDYIVPYYTTAAKLRSDYAAGLLTEEEYTQQWGENQEKILNTVRKTTAEFYRNASDLQREKISEAVMDEYTIKTEGWFSGYFDRREELSSHLGVHNKSDKYENGLYTYVKELTALEQRLRGLTGLHIDPAFAVEDAIKTVTTFESNFTQVMDKISAKSNATSQDVQSILDGFHFNNSDGSETSLGSSDGILKTLENIDNLYTKLKDINEDPEALRIDIQTNIHDSLDDYVKGGQQRLRAFVRWAKDHPTEIYGDVANLEKQLDFIDKKMQEPDWQEHEIEFTSNFVSLKEEMEKEGRDLLNWVENANSLEVFIHGDTDIDDTIEQFTTYGKHMLEDFIKWAKDNPTEFEGDITPIEESLKSIEDRLKEPDWQEHTTDFVGDFKNLKEGLQNTQTSLQAWQKANGKVEIEFGTIIKEGTINAVIKFLEAIRKVAEALNIEGMVEKIDRSIENFLNIATGSGAAGPQDETPMDRLVTAYANAKENRGKDGKLVVDFQEFTDAELQNRLQDIKKQIAAKANRSQDRDARADLYEQQKLIEDELTARDPKKTQKKNEKDERNAERARKEKEREEKEKEKREKAARDLENLINDVRTTNSTIGLSANINVTVDDFLGDVNNSLQAANALLRERLKIENELRKKRDSLDKKRDQAEDKARQSGREERKAVDENGHEYSTYLTEEEIYWFNQQEILIEKEKQRKLRDLYDKENQDRWKYLEEYGSFLAKQYALTEEYAQKISRAQEEGKSWDVLRYKQEYQAKSRKAQASELESQIGTIMQFADMGEMALAALPTMLNTLRDFTKQNEYKSMSPEQQKVILEAIQKLQEQVGGTGDRQGYVDAVREYQASCQTLINAMNADAVAQKEVNLKYTELQSISAAKGEDSTEYKEAKEAFDKLQAVALTTSELFNVAKSELETAQTNVKTKYDQAFTTKKTEFGEFITGTGTQLGELYTEITNLITLIDKLKAIGEIADAAAGVSESLECAGEAAKLLSDAADAGAESLSEAIGGIKHEVKQQLVTDAEGNVTLQDVDKMKETITNILPEKFGEGLSKGLASAGVIGQIVATILKILDILKDGIGPLIAGIIDTVLNAVSGIIGNIISGDFILQIGESIGNGLSKLFDTLTFGALDLSGHDAWQKKNKEVQAQLDLITATRDLERAFAETADKLNDWLNDRGVSEFQENLTRLKDTREDYYAKLNEEQVKYKDRSAGLAGVAGAIGGAIAGAVAGLFIGGPIGAVIGALGGGIVGGIAQNVARHSQDYAAAKDNLRVQTRHKTWFRSEKSQDLRDYMKEKYGMDLFNESGQLNLDVYKKIKDLDLKLLGNTKETLDKLAELEEERLELVSELNRYYSNLLAPFADDMVSAMWKWYDEGTDALGEFKKNAVDTFRSIAEEYMKAMMEEQVFAKYRDQISSLIEGFSTGDKSMEELTNSFKTLGTSLAQDLEKMIPGMQAFLESFDLGLLDAGYSINPNNVQKATGAAFESMTADQADALEGRFTAIQGDVARILEILEYVYMSGDYIASVSGPSHAPALTSYQSFEGNDAILSYLGSVQLRLDSIETTIIDFSTKVNIAYYEMNEGLSTISTNTKVLPEQSDILQRIKRNTYEAI